MTQFYFKPSDGPNVGPLSAEEFQQRQDAGEIKAETMVWRSGMTDWATCASMRAQEQRAAQPQTPPPLPLNRTVAAKTVPVRGKGFSACGSCGQDWPDSLLSTEDGKQICGNCLNRIQKEIKDGRRKVSASNGWGAWACMILAIICAVGMYYRVSHYGIGPPPGKATEFTAPAKYGR